MPEPGAWLIYLLAISALAVVAGSMPFILIGG